MGGFFAAPEELIPSIAALVRLRTEEGCEHAIVDPCAGEAAALVGLTRCWLDFAADDFHLYACELEETRARAAQNRLWRESGERKSKLVHGDAFYLQWGEDRWRVGGATVAYLNPPYDLDPEHGRLEERWLRRFVPAIAVGGALLFFVPFDSLPASAATLATHFEELSCWRVPAPHFAVYKQAVLVARRRPALLGSDAAVEAQVRAWGADASAIPELPAEGPAVLEVAPIDGAGFARWEVAPLDVRGLLGQMKPWHATDRGGRLAPIPGVLPEGPFDQLLAPTFPLACPPKPAHIAAGIASGALSGARLDPDDAGAGLPSLLVKGTFRKRFQTVDQRTNKDGDVTAEIQVQHPELEITALDLRRGRYHRLGADVAVTGARDVAGMTAGDLLASYGRSLLATLRERCPALYDPARDAGSIELPALPRKLYTAQEHAVRAICRLLDGPDKAAILLGEVGSGKTTVTLATAATRGARRVLVMCPPHLQKTWVDQAAAVVPWARTVVLDDVAAVEAFAVDQTDGMAIGILSREAAKLGHAWAGISGRCPRCGTAIATEADENARKRLRCEHTELVPSGRVARMAERLAALLAPVFPDQAGVRQLIRGRVAQRFLGVLVQRRAEGADPWPAIRPKLAPLARRVGTWVMSEEREPRREAVDILTHLLLAADDEATTVRVARGIYLASLKDARAWGWGSRFRQIARELMLLLPPGGEAQRALAEELRGHAVEDAPYGGGSWESWGRHVAGRESEYVWRAYRLLDGRVCIEKLPVGSAEAAHAALAKLTAHGRWVETAPCAEPLFQAIPEPRRIPLAHYIARRHPRLFDLIVVDEVHEAGCQDSAQSLAAQQLFQLRRPTIALTGSVMNGYASSLFILLWSLSGAFRAEFGRDEEGEFVRRYGYLKQVVELRDKDSKKPVSYGAMSDRVERVERTSGQAPGVLPALLLRHLLPIAVTLHVDDLGIDLPPAEEIVEQVEPGPELGRRYQALQRTLLQQIKRDRFSQLAGRLFGQLAELPSYLDRATDDVGNAEGGAYQIRYPEAVGGGVVAEQPGLPAGELLPKEAWLVDVVRRELAEGRNVMVFCWHLELMPRLARLLEEATGEKAPILWADKVSPKKREAWIDREIVGKGRRILVVNPVAVQTGLNNLVHFASVVWYENPACNPLIRRQAIGRVRRIGQRLQARVYTPVYKGTLQEVLHRLLLHKVGVSEAADGLDATAALQAAGVGAADELAGRDLGRLLYEMLTRGEREEAPAERPAPTARRGREPRQIGMGW
ncbi:DUF6094 domain-containing protein [Sorangium sp. So ce134]